MADNHDGVDPQNQGGVDPNDDQDLEEASELEVPDDASDEEKEQIESTNKLIKERNKAIRQKQHWRGNAVDPKTGKLYKDLVGGGQRPQTDTITPKTHDGDDDVKERLGRLEGVEEKRAFGHRHGYSPEVTDEIFAYAKGAGITPNQALEKPGVQAMISSLNADARNAAAIPGATSRSPKVEGKAFKDMSPEERAKNWPNMTESLRRRR